MHPLSRSLVVLYVGLASAACPSSGGRAAVTWSRSFGGPGGDEAAAAIPTSEGGYLLAGTAEAYFESGEPADESQIDGDLWLVKLTGSGDLDWQRSYGRRRLSPAGNRIDYTSVRPALDGGFWVGGTESAGEFATGNPLTDGGNLVVTRLDAAGNPLWTRIHDSGAFAGFPFSSPQGSAHEEVRDLAPTSDGGLVAACWVAARVDQPLEGRRGIDVNALWIAKLDAGGDLVWGRHLTSDGDGVEYDRYFPYDPDAAIHVLARATDEDGAFVAALSDRHDESRCTRIQSDGSVLWTTDLEGVHVLDALPIDDDHVSGQADGVRDDGFLLAGTQDPFGGRDGLLARLDPVGGSLEWSWTEGQVERFEALDQRCIAGTNSCSFVAAGTRPAGGENGLPREGRLMFFWEVSDPDDGVYPPVVLQDPLLAEATPDLHFSAALDEWQLLGLGDGQAFAARYGGLLLESLGSRFLDRVPDAATAQSLDDRSVLDLAVRTTPAGQEPVLSLQDPSGGVALETVFPAEGRFVERAHSVVEVEGGYALLGETSSFEDGELAAWLLRLDERGEVLWQRLFPEVELRRHEDRGGGVDPLGDQRVDLLRATGDGGLAFAGWVDGHLLLVRLDPAGEELWRSASLSPQLGGMREGCAALIETADGGFALAGQDGAENAWVARLEANGAVLWRRSFQAADFPYLFTRALAETGGGLIVAGSRRVRPSDLWVLWLDESGAPVRSAVYGISEPGKVTEQGDAVRIAATEEGELLIAAAHVEHEPGTDDRDEGAAPTGRQNVLLLRIDAAGEPQWYRVYGGLYDETVAGLSAVPEGGWLVAGRSDSLGERSEAWCLRVDHEGLISEACNAYHEGGPWPGSVEPLPLVVTDYEPFLDVSPPVESLDTTVEPGTAQLVAVARQCVGFTPPDGGGGGGGGGGELTLTMLFEGGGGGRVTSTPAGIDCRATCSARFPAGTRVALTPAVDEGSFFSHWEGADEDFGIEGCTVTLTSDRTVTVFFE